MFSYKYFYFLLVFTTSLDVCVLGVNIDPDDFGRLFSKEFDQYFQTGEKTDHLQDLLNVFQDSSVILSGFPQNVMTSDCLKCYSIVNSILHFVDDPIGNVSDTEKFIRFLNELCTLTKADVPTVCDGMSRIYQPTITYILLNTKSVKVDEICGILLQGLYCIKQFKPYEAIQIGENVREVKIPKRMMVKSSRNLTILHLSDFHYDPYYVVGSNSHCEEYVCCRGEKVKNTSIAAGKWGDYNSCDSPGYLLENLLENAAKNYPQIDYIYFTGDYVDHFSFNNTRELCVSSMKYVTDLVKRQFPDIQVFPVLGNHEAYPANAYAPSNISDPDVSSAWLFETAAKYWSDWLPNEALVTLRHGGYYTVSVRPDLRIIVLNSNVCIGSNIWLIYDHFFFKDQLEWLRDTLETAAIVGQKVHILGHVPPNDLFCYKPWAHEYKRIVYKYSDIISGQFHGHSHLDEFVLFYSIEDPNVPINVAWNGGSGTSFAYFNSNYKTYFVDDRSYEVLDYETWIFNLTEANLTPDIEPKWFKEYSFKDFYELEDLSPSSIDGLLDKIHKNETLLTEFWKIIVKQSDDLLGKGCDRKCLLQFFNAASRTDFDVSKQFF